MDWLHWFLLGTATAFGVMLFHEDIAVSTPAFHPAPESVTAVLSVFIAVSLAMTLFWYYA